MMTQEQEHWAHEDGRFQNESQAALAVSRATISITDMSSKISQLTRAGNHVLHTWCDVYCPATDAGLGTEVHIVFASRSRARVEAEALKRFGSLESDSDICGHCIAPARSD